MNNWLWWKCGTLIRVLLLAVLLSLHLPGPVRAQSNTIRFETLTVEDGLSQSTVRAILQDSTGFLWFGTDDGLNKYDGYTFTIFKADPGNPLAINDNSIQALFEDSQGILWVGTGLGLARFDQRKQEFYNYANDPENPLSLRGQSVTAIAEDSQGNLWVGTQDGGLNLLDRGDNSFTHFQNYPNELGSLTIDQVTALVAEPARILSPNQPAAVTIGRLESWSQPIFLITQIVRMCNPDAGFPAMPEDAGVRADCIAIGTRMVVDAIEDIGRVAGQ